VVEPIQGYLKQVGVTMRVVDLEWGALSQLAAQPVEKNQVQAVLFGWRSVNGDIDSAIQEFGSAFWRPRGNDGSLCKNDEFDRPLAFEQGTLDTRKRLETLHRMQGDPDGELPALWLHGEPRIWPPGGRSRAWSGIRWSRSSPCTPRTSRTRPARDVLEPHTTA
jgi:ABC-type transport system substrate-binding protein